MRRLMIRPGGIGDCLLSFPAMEHLRADYTEVWAPAAVVPLVQFADRVRPISSTGIELAGLDGLAMDPALADRLRQFDHIVSWYGTARPEFRETLRSTGVRATFLKALPPKYGCCHASDFFCSQVGAPLGQSPRLAVAAGTRRNTAVIHPFSGSSAKNWPLERFQKLAATLDFVVEWTAGPEELLPNAHRFDDLAALANWIAGAKTYFGNDSGITHLAAATGIPTVALFGPTNAERWAPRGPNVRVVSWAEADGGVLEPAAAR